MHFLWYTGLVVNFLQCFIGIYFQKTSITHLLKYSSDALQLFIFFYGKMRLRYENWF